MPPILQEILILIILILYKFQRSIIAGGVESFPKEINSGDHLTKWIIVTLSKRSATKVWRAASGEFFTNMPPRLPEMALPKPCKLLNIINNFNEASIIAVGEEPFAIYGGTVSQRDNREAISAERHHKGWRVASPHRLARSVPVFFYQSCLPYCRKWQ